MHEKVYLINFKEAFSYGVSITKKKLTLLLSISFLLFFFELAMNSLDFFLLENIYSLIIQIFAFLVSFIFQYNVLKISLDILNNKKTSIKKIFQIPNFNIIKFLLGNMIYTILVFLGLLAFVLPGIYFAIKYFFVPILIVDKKMGIFESAEKSSEMTKGVKWELFAYFLILSFASFLIVLAGIFVLIIGVIPAIFFVSWVSSFASLHIYKKLI